LNYPHLIGRGQDISTGIETHGSIFLNPIPTVATINSNVDDLITAHQAVRNRTIGAAEVRLVRANTLVSTLVASQAYVQGVINTAPPDQGPMIAKAAGMRVGQTSPYVKPVIEATQAQPGAPVHLDANVAALTTGVKGRVYFNWQMSSDGGKTWLSTPSTPHGNTDVSGLTALATYMFRVSITSRQGPGPWCEAITFLVH
jgi:hypothetical protein